MLNSHPASSPPRQATRKAAAGTPSTPAGAAGTPAAAALSTPAAAARSPASALVTPQPASKRAAGPSSPASAARSPAPALGTPLPASKRARAPEEAAQGAAPELRGLSGCMPVLWAQVGFAPEGTGAPPTPAQRLVLGVIAEHYALPPGTSVGTPLSGMSGEEHLLAAYYNGRLTLLPGHAAPPLVCCQCGAGGHLPSACSAGLRKD